MKQNTYRLIASILIFVLTLIFVGCNGGTEPTDPSTIPTGTTQQTQGTTPETTVPESTTPETTTSETTVPETTVPETTVPETTAPVETQPTVTQPPATEPEDVVYEEIDAANSVELLESRLHNWPSFGESQTAMTDFTWTYVITASQTPVCSVRSVEAISATLGGSACEIYQTSTKENAWAIVKKYGAEFAVNSDLITVIQIKSPEVEMDRDADYIDMPLEVILRFTLENGQVMDLRYTDDVIWTGSGGVLMDCKSEDFQ